LIALPGGRYATSDVNDLYRRVINRNNRMRRLIELRAPAIIVESEHRQLQAAVDALIANAELPSARRVRGPDKRPLSGIGELFFASLRATTRALDYAARARCIVDDRAPGEIAVPHTAALEVLRPWLYGRLERDDIV